MAPRKRARSRKTVSTQLGNQPSILLKSEHGPADFDTPAEVPKPSLISLASTCSDVAAFCRATLSKVIPKDFWGAGAEGEENRSVVMQNVDRFVRLRRFESFSLHLVSQGLKV